MEIQNTSIKKIAIVGGGPASMILAAELNAKKYDISVFEKNAALGRKFLVAGKGGFNLTHSEPIDLLEKKYIPDDFQKRSLNCFNNSDLREWFDNIGIKTYIGTSKRVFPVKGTKPIEVLKAIEEKLKTNKVKIYTEHEWKGFAGNGELMFFDKSATKYMKFDIVVFALGGGSWQVTGSNDKWLGYFSGKGVAIKQFEPSNCAFKIEWGNKMIKEMEGKVLKNCHFSCGSKTHKGEAVLTKFGIEGSGVYPLSSEIRKQLKKSGKTTVKIDFKPELSEPEIEKRFDKMGKLNIKQILSQKVNLTDLQCDLIKQETTKEQYTDPKYLSKLIKAFSLNITGLAPIDEAISTVGGIDLNEVDENLELKKMPNHYCIGEMLDWDAPTGGYLLQGCFSMGYYLAQHLNMKM
ncbi:MAG: TIGR03862 family flavoprotein [Bacteroidota bacterium]|nr:TIGR03862 family flavoprotein [Bacteroidota bacterium]